MGREVLTDYTEKLEELFHYYKEGMYFDMVQPENNYGTRYSIYAVDPSTEETVIISYVEKADERRRRVDLAPFIIDEHQGKAIASFAKLQIITYDDNTGNPRPVGHINTKGSNWNNPEFQNHLIGMCSPDSDTTGWQVEHYIDSKNRNRVRMTLTIEDDGKYVYEKIIDGDGMGRAWVEFTPSEQLTTTLVMQDDRELTIYTSVNYGYVLNEGDGDGSKKRDPTGHKYLKINSIDVLTDM